MISPTPKTAFHVSPWIDRVGGFIERRRNLWIRLGNMETRLLSDRLSAAPVRQPIYIAGLARSGTTILLEKLSRFPGIVTHRYKDFPFIFTPYWWNAFLDRTPQRRVPPTERSHGDRILVTPDSPEAMEEGLWMAFFPHLHDPYQDNTLTERSDHPDFEAFYRAHIQKLLLARKGTRYLSKGNYNIARLTYLHKLFPDARFLIPVRAPAAHIASLMRQHETFLKGVTAVPKARDHLRRVGHFEFGPDIRPINIGQTEETRTILALWQSGEAVRGWARYWAQIYGFVLRQRETHPALRQASKIVRYEDLCNRPGDQFAMICTHCRLDANRIDIPALAATISAPAYYTAPFSSRDLAVIHEETRAVAEAFGYGES